METIDPNGGLVVIGDKLHVRYRDGFLLIDLTPSDMRRLALRLGIAADRLEGRESPPEMLFLAGELEAGGVA